MGERMQIGEVAERTGLSLRTIRYYGEMGLATPSGRSQGGFRLYTQADVTRLMIIKQMKPLGYQLEQMRELLELLYPPELDGSWADTVGEQGIARLAEFATSTEERCTELRTALATAEAFATMLRAWLDQSTRTDPRTES